MISGISIISIIPMITSLFFDEKTSPKKEFFESDLSFEFLDSGKNKNLNLSLIVFIGLKFKKEKS